MTALGLGGLLLGAMLLTSGTASAGQVSGGGRQVVFGGGGDVLGLTCESTPSVEALRVPADGTVRVVNRTGRGAKLRIDGQERGAIPADGSAEVVFRRGTSRIALEPSCAITDQATPVLVTATPTAPDRPDPMPAPGELNPEPDPTAPTWIPLPDTHSAWPDSTGPGPRPSTRSPIKPHITRGKPARGETTTRRAAPPVKIKTKSTSGGTAGASVPLSDAEPSGDAATVLPGVPTIDLSLTPTLAAPALPGVPPADVVAAEPVAALHPLPDSQPLGLLTLIASVCVAGVAAGLIRAIVSQRASRT